MSFLKTHWRFTVPAVIVLCAVLAGVFTLYSTSEPPEPETVYAMPERSPDNPPALNTGGVLLTASNTDVDTPVGTIATATSETLESELVSDAESVEACCPEDASFLATHDGTSLTPEQRERNRRSWERYAALKHAHDEYDAKSDAYTAQLLDNAERTRGALMKLYRLFPAAARAVIRQRAEDEAALEDRAQVQGFLTAAESLPVPTPEEVSAEFMLLQAESKVEENTARELALDLAELRRKFP